MTNESPVQGLPFGVGGGLVAIKTLLSRDPCAHATVAIQMIDAILKEHPAKEPTVCKHCYGIGYDASGFACTCTTEAK